MTGERLARWWVDRYTRGLADDARDARRAELTSDLWEHRSAYGAAGATQLAIVSRCVRGIPADLSWRRLRRRRGHWPAVRPAAHVLGWSAAALSYLFLIATHGWGATALVGLDLYGRDWEPGDVEVFSRISGAVLALLVVGLLLLRRRPRTGASMLALGALATPVAFWWAAPLYVPIGTAVTAAGIVLARRSRERQALARATTS